MTCYSVRANEAWRNPCPVIAMVSRRVRSFGAAALLMLAWSTSWALGGDGTLADLRQTVWTAREGAPTASNLLEQTSDGYLWMGDETGLYRFDALRFEHVELSGQPELSSSTVSSLFAPKSGGLWIGYYFGGAAFLRDGEVTAYGSREGLPAATVSAIAQQPDGTLWIATTRGLGRLLGGRWQPLGVDWNLPAAVSAGLMVDSTGAVWIETNDTLYRLGPGQHRFEPIWPVVKLTIHVVEAPTGEVWASDGSILKQVYQNPASNLSWASQRSPLLVDGEGAIWHFTEWPPGIQDHGDQGLVRIARRDLPKDGASLLLSQAKDRLTAIGGRPTANVGILLLDHEGNVWLSSSSGPVRFSERNISAIKLPDDRINWGFSAFAADEEGSVWISVGMPGSFYRIRAGEKPSLEKLRGVTCVALMRSGELWAATTIGLWRRHAGRFEPLPQPPTGPSDRIQSMAESGDGTAWISILHKGLFRLADGHWLANGGLAALQVGTAIILSDDRSGRLWAGYPDGRIAVVAGSDVHFYGRDDGLRVGHVLALYGRRRSLWAGGDAGLARFDGQRFRPVLTDQPGVLRNVSGIVETASGDVWLNAATGLVHLPATELNRAIADPAYRVSAEVFGAQAGLEGTGARTTPLPTLIESKDGRIWASTSVGTYTIDPAHVFRSPLPPPISLQAFTADDHSEPTQGVVALPPRTSELHLRYEGLSLTAAEQVRYRYRLDGLDKDWHLIQDQRDAYYMNLGPGSYRFRVQSKIAGMDWSPTEAVVAFSIAPAFMQTRLFFVLCGLGTVFLVWLVLRLRVSQIARRIRIGLIARIGERERIARELHDTLLQGTQGLLLSVHAVAVRAHRGEQVGDTLDQVLASADEVVTESRDRIQDLRAAMHSSTGLQESMQALGSELQRDGDAKLQVVVRGIVRELDPTVADEAFCIGREALRNAFKHAEAEVVEVEIVYGVDQFELRIRDDGRGIAAQALEAGSRPGHWGLPGMRERAQRISARLDVRRRADAGTEVELSVLARAAYTSGATPVGWLARLRSLIRRGSGGKSDSDNSSPSPTRPREGHGHGRSTEPGLRRR